MTGLSVAVAGAGLGGLCLAQGLARAGVDVTVYERDTALATRRQGYRIHLGPHAGQAIAACVPPELYELFTATCGQSSTAVTVLSERLRVLHAERAGPAGPQRLEPATLSLPASRQTLREVLAHGLADRIRFGAEFRGFATEGDRVRLHLAGAGGAGADGDSSVADVLVGADGVGSAVRRQYLPHAEVTDTGTRCVYGRSPLREELLAALPPDSGTGFSAVVGRRAGLAMAPLRFRRPPEQAARDSGLGAALSPAADYLMWAVTAQRQDWPVAEERWDAMTPGELHETAQEMIRRWDPAVRELVAAGEEAECFLIRIRSAQPVPAWQPSRVTLLGDAIHAMSPARGSGASTALRDAALLAAELAGAARGGKAVTEAIGDYERAMRDYGFAAVAESARAEAATVRRRQGPGARIAARLPRGQRGSRGKPSVPDKKQERERA